MAHVSRPAVDLTARGPRDDRAFCLVDKATSDVVRTVDNDNLLACRAVWEPPTLTISTPLGDVSVLAPRRRTDAGDRDVRTRRADYWGRTVELVEVGGPADELLSRYLGRAVVLCQLVRTRSRPRPGADARPSRHEPRAPDGVGVVWGGAVSLVTTSSVAEAARRVGRPADDGARFRATFVIDTGAAPAFVEDSWVGHRLRIGAAVVAVRGPMPRCAVVDRRPGAGGRDSQVLRALAADRRVGPEILFGVDADVVEPGTVRTGDRISS